jgi:hypothetical protein
MGEALDINYPAYPRRVISERDKKNIPVYNENCFGLYKSINETANKIMLSTKPGEKLDAMAYIFFKYHGNHGKDGWILGDRFVCSLEYVWDKLSVCVRKKIVNEVVYLLENDEIPNFRCWERLFRI